MALKQVLTILNWAPLTIPTTPEGNVWVYFAPSKNISTVSAADVISGLIPPEFFEGKVALVGTSAAGLARS